MIQAVQDIHQRGFAGAVFTQQGMDFALAQVEIDIVVGQHAREMLGDAFGFENNIDYPSYCSPISRRAMPSAAGGVVLPTTPVRIDHGQDVGSQTDHVRVAAGMPIDGGISSRKNCRLICNGLRCTEDQRSRPGAERRPVAEDHGCQGDKTAPIGHQRLEGWDGFEGEVGTCQPGQQPADDHIGVAHAVHIDAHRIGRPGVLAHRTGAQAPAGVEQDKMGDEDQDDGCDGDRLLVERSSPEASGVDI